MVVRARWRGRIVCRGGRRRLASRRKSPAPPPGFLHGAFHPALPSTHRTPHFSARGSNCLRVACRQRRRIAGLALALARGPARGAALDGVMPSCGIVRCAIHPQSAGPADEVECAAARERQAGRTLRPLSQALQVERRRSRRTWLRRHAELERVRHAARLASLVLRVAIPQLDLHERAGAWIAQGVGCPVGVQVELERAVAGGVCPAR